MPFFRRKGKPKPELPETLSVTKVGIKRIPSNRSNTSPNTPGSADSFFNGDIGVPDALLTSGGGIRPTGLLLSDANNPSSYDGQLDSPMRTSSRLSKTLQEILHDRDGITCFLQFMESRKAGHFMKFWLDAESFQASSVLRTQSRSLKRKSSSLSKIIQDDSPTAEISHSNSPALQDAFANRTNSSLLGDKDSVAEFEKENHITLSHQSCSDPGHLTDLGDVHKDRTSSSSSLENSNQHKERGPCASESLSDNSELNTDKKVRPGLSEEELQEKLRKSVQRDAVIIFTKYISPDATDPINVTEQLRNETIRRICKEDGEVDPASFADCQQFVVEKMNTEYYQDFLDSEYHCKHQVDVLTGGKVYLADFLYNKFALCYFMEFVEQDGGSHLLQFWLAADNFQQHLSSHQGSYDGMQAQGDAMVLYDKYFSLQATEPLGFDDKTRFEVEGSICREGGPLPDCFAKPRDIVLHTLEKVHFPNFLKSEMYYKFLSDLVNTVQLAQDMPMKPKLHIRQASDTSSQHSAGSESLGADSIGSKNTLLAMNTQHIAKRTAKSIGDEMRIDAMLLNPDELWKRPEAGPMTLGTVNTLGQFVSEFIPEPDQDKKKGSVRFFSKNKAKEKEQEDMALRIAQMIINDVTTMTQTGDVCAGVSSFPLDNSSSEESTIPQSSVQPHGAS